MLLTSCGPRLEAHRSFRQVRGVADTLLIVGVACFEAGREDAAVVQWLQRIAHRLRRIGSICTGAFLLARAGLLNRRRATTHWKYCELLTRRYPAVKVEPDPIFVRDGNLYTSAGVTAGMDMALRWWRRTPAPTWHWKSRVNSCCTCVAQEVSRSSALH